MSIDLGLAFDHMILLPTIILGLLAVKFILIVLACRIFFIPLSTAMRTALILASGGEFAFVIFAPAMANGIIPMEVGQLLYAAVAISMGFTPLLDSLGKYLEGQQTEEESKLTIKKALRDLKDHVIILGFGRVGKLVGRMLTERVIPFVSIDEDMDRVNLGRARGWPVFYGDAMRPKVLDILGAKKAKVVVVCLSSSSNSMKIALDILRNYPHVKVCVRLRDDRYAKKLIAAGAQVIVPENLEPSLQLASAVLRGIGTSEEETKQLIDDFRKTLSSNPNLDPDEQVSLMA
jgi:monovalent cation:H+ antiporter-2, CPA2 family